MTNQKLRFSRVIWVLAAGVGLAQAAVGCTEDARSSSSTNWLGCDDDADCEAFEGARCRSDDVCVDEDGEPIPVDATGGIGPGGSANRGGRTSTDTGGRPNSGGSPASTGGSPASTGGTEAGGAGGAPSSGGSAAIGGEAGSTEPIGGAPTSAGAGGQSTGVGGSSNGGSGGGQLQCNGGVGGTGYAQLEVDRSCQTDDDCFVGDHTFNCCGSTRTIGVNVSERERFEAYERGCSNQAMCECASLRETEEGVRITKGGVTAACVDNMCRAICVADGCAVTDDCSADDECREANGSCRYIDPNVLIDICRQDDGSCVLCP